MKGLPWGLWYNEYGDQGFDADALEARIQELFADEYEVTRLKGVYEYLLTGDDDDDEGPSWPPMQLILGGKDE